MLVPDSLLAYSGQYYELSLLGQPNSEHRRLVLQRSGGNIEAALGEGLAVLYLGKNALLAWLIWLTSWLVAAGPRRAPLVSYVPDDYVWGIKV